MNEPILMPIGTRGQRASTWSNQLCGSGGQRSRSYDAEDRFGEA